MINLYVGPERKRFVVHKKLLTSQSAFFDKALNGGFMEADKGSIHLEEDDAASVALLVGFLYRGTIPGTDKKVGPFVRFASLTTLQENAPVTMAESTDGTSRPFSATPFVGLFGHEYFQHISSQPQYASFSPEELRVADYKVHRIHPGVSLTPAAQNNGHASLPTAHLALPQQGTSQANIPPQSTSSTPQSADNLRLPPPTLYGGATHNTASDAASYPNHPAHALPPLQQATPSPDVFAMPPQDYVNTGRPSLGFYSGAPTGFPDKLTPASGLEPFGMSRTISYPSSASIYIKGIPRSKLFGNNCLGTDAYQLAILKLCLLAERVIWPALFNAAIAGYIRGELAANRPVPAHHIDLIYGNSSPDSTLRIYAIESLCMNAQQDNSTYLPLARKYDDFLEDILNELSASRHDKDVTWSDASLELFGMRTSDYKTIVDRRSDRRPVLSGKEG